MCGWASLPSCYNGGNRFFPPKFCFVQFGVGQFRTIFPVWFYGEGASTPQPPTPATPLRQVMLPASMMVQRCACWCLPSRCRGGGWKRFVSFPRRWFQRCFYVSSRKFGGNGSIPQNWGKWSNFLEQIFFKKGWNFEATDEFSVDIAWGPNINWWLPSRELTYPPKMAFWRWFSFSQGAKVGYVNSLEGIHSSYV